MLETLARHFEPDCVHDLDLDRVGRSTIRREVRTLRMNDSTGFGGKTDRTGRVRLGGAWRWVMIVLVAGGLPMGLMIATPVLADAVSDWAQLVLLILLFAVLEVVLWAFPCRWLWKRAMIPYYATVLRRHGIAICPKCGYHAPGGRSGRTCAECGFEDPLEDPAGS
ncbi:MAG: hypothetical protein VX726_08075 [Planctomycetota bacterium]|nr:hypothetical protein [Planctomycetota bacterium]